MQTWTIDGHGGCDSYREFDIELEAEVHAEEKLDAKLFRKMREHICAIEVK